MQPPGRDQFVQRRKVGDYNVEGAYGRNRPSFAVRQYISINTLEQYITGIDPELQILEAPFPNAFA